MFPVRITKGDPFSPREPDPLRRPAMKREPIPGCLATEPFRLATRTYVAAVTIRLQTSISGVDTRNGGPIRTEKGGGFDLSKLSDAELRQLEQLHERASVED